MKPKLIIAGLLTALALFLSGCATPVPVGLAYTNVNFPIIATPNQLSDLKVGTAVSRSFLALVACGDSSIQAAVKNGGITKISHVDYKAKNILGLYGVYTTTVYGE